MPSSATRSRTKSRPGKAFSNSVDRGRSKTTPGSGKPTETRPTQDRPLAALFQRTATGTSALFEEVEYEMADEDYASSGGLGRQLASHAPSRVSLRLNRHGKGIEMRSQLSPAFAVLRE